MNTQLGVLVIALVVPCCSNASTQPVRNSRADVVTSTSQKRCACVASAAVTRTENQLTDWATSNPGLATGPAGKAHPSYIAPVFKSVDPHANGKASSGTIATCPKIGTVTRTPTGRGTSTDESRVTDWIRREIVAEKSLQLSEKTVAVVAEGTTVVLRGQVNFPSGAGARSRLGVYGLRDF